ncbi:hypothetical protein [Rhodovulum sp.]|uniref:hypothetical protein n=1 Tax=Rhodovulum sp. TaxID=34009 RepID=UPI0017B4F6BE|nr:hypothetical protein [Rhodovulum sp.]HDR28823.1 hypothetical protein [Rhodovulum sp.]
MVPRKPLTSVLKRDPGFSATLSPGPKRLADPLDDAPDGSMTPPALPAAAGTPEPARAGAAPDHQARPGPGTADVPTSGPPSGRGVKLSIAVSIADAEVAAVEAYAAHALVTPQQLLREIAQRAKREIVGAWLETGFPGEDDSEPRGKLTTSVSVTLPQALADRIAAAHDPMGLMGIARIVAPTYRNAFSRALRKALRDAGL